MPTCGSGSWRLEGGQARYLRAGRLALDVLPVNKLPATGRYSLQNRLICGQNLDDGFDGWSGAAHIDWPGQPVALELSSNDAGYFQVYSPVGGGFFAVAPGCKAGTFKQYKSPYFYMAVCTCPF